MLRQQAPSNENGLVRFIPRNHNYHIELPYNNVARIRYHIVKYCYVLLRITAAVLKNQTFFAATLVMFLV